jgi:hypothetical protein
MPEFAVTRSSTRHGLSQGAAPAVSNAWPRPVSKDLPASLLAALVPAAAGAAARRELTLFRGIDGFDIAGALKAPGMGAIEWREERSPEQAKALLQRAADHLLYINVSTNAAAKLDLAQPVAAELEARGLISHAARADTELALHEAISNALMHGNLAVDSLDALSLAELSRFSSELNNRLADPLLAGRPLEIAASQTEGNTCIEIHDDGAGYDAASHASRQAGRKGNSPPSGRGIALIADLTSGYELFDGGRGIRLRLKP